MKNHIRCCLTTSSPDTGNVKRYGTVVGGNSICPKIRLDHDGSVVRYERNILPSLPGQKGQNIVYNVYRGDNNSLAWRINFVQLGRMVN